MNQEILNIFLVNPRGFCAGVTRAIDIVDISLKKYPNKKIYIRNEIVHNETVVNKLKEQGVTFIKDVTNLPTDSLAIFSAHGVSAAVENSAKDNNLHFIDATCPLVKKVHMDAIKYSQMGYYIILIGHINHPETEGTSGRIEGNYSIVETIEDVQRLDIPQDSPITYITQTTLSLDDTSDIVNAIKQKYPNIHIPKSNNICYATQNRQNAIKSIVNKIDTLIVVGSKNSSNSNRLKEIGDKNNIPSFLINNHYDLPIDAIISSNNLGISAGASAPEDNVNKIIEEIKRHRKINIINEEIIEENVLFHLPKELRG